MKTQPPLLLRDALANAFCAAARGEPAALHSVEALARWRERPGADPALAALRTERGEPLFSDVGELAASFAGLGDYVRDRALRFSVACQWLRQEGGLGDVLAAARAAWDAGLFFEVHELLEPLWMDAHGPRRETLQGLIMAGAALHHLSEGNRAGARALLRDAARKLAAQPRALPRPADLTRFGADLGALAERIESGEVRDIADVATLPTLAD